MVSEDDKHFHATDAIFATNSDLSTSFGSFKLSHYCYNKVKAQRVTVLRANSIVSIITINRGCLVKFLPNKTTHFYLPHRSNIGQPVIYFHARDMQ